jgi:hypothetical protein
MSPGVPVRQTEPGFVNDYGAEESIPPHYVARGAATTNRVVVPARQAGNRFLGSLKGLQIQAQGVIVTAGIGWRNRFLSSFIKGLQISPS